MKILKGGFDRYGSRAVPESDGPDQKNVHSDTTMDVVVIQMWAVRVETAMEMPCGGLLRCRIDS